MIRSAVRDAASSSNASAETHVSPTHTEIAPGSVYPQRRTIKGGAVVRHAPQVREWVDLDERIVHVRDVEISDVLFAGCVPGRFSKEILDNMTREHLMMPLDRNAILLVPTNQPAPRVLVVSQPTELIVTDGEPLAAALNRKVIPNFGENMILQTRRSISAAFTSANLVLFFVAVACGSSAIAAEPYIYPANGQTPEVQEQDKYSCYQFGKTQTGFDPMKAQAAPAAAPTKQGGALKGAAGGAIIGGIADGSDGAKTGAAIGATLGAMRRRGSQKKQQQAQQQQAAAAQQSRDNYDRAFSACMQGRGYTLN